MKTISLFGFKKIQIILTCLFIFTFCYSENFKLTNYISHSWTTNDGLPSNVITSITQDSLGYIYFGTYVGLVRFNGSEFSTINRNTYTSVPFVSARVIIENRSKKLWIGSNEGGVSILDENRINCSVLPHDLPSVSVRSIIETQNDEMWIGTANGIMCYENGNKIINIPAPENNGIEDSNIVQLFCDSYNQIWCITSYGRVYIYNRETKKFELYKPLFLQHKKVSAIFQDSEENFWFGLNNNSAIMVKADTGTLPSDTSEYRIYSGKDGIISGCDITSFAQDSNNSIWIGTDRGIFIVTREDKIYFYTQSEGLINNAVNSIYSDREHNIWIGTDRGGIQKLTRSRFTSVRTDEAVNCILDDRTRLWIGTDKGLLCYKNETFIENDITKLCRTLKIRHLAAKKDGSLMISTYSDLGQLIVKDGTVTSLNEQNGLSINKVRVALELSNDTIAIGTAKGLNIFHPETGEFSIYTTLNGLTNDFIMSLWEDNEKNLWIGTDGGGINVMRNGQIIKTFTSEKNNLAGDVVFKISQDKNNIFWICTGTGLSRYDGESFFNYNISNGLGNDSIFQMLIDRFDVAWIVSNGGISSIRLSQLEDLAAGDNISLEIKHYNKNDGLFANGVTSTALSIIDKKGRPCFTMVEGISFYDQKKTNDISPPSAVIEKIDTTTEIIFPVSNEKIIIPASNKRITINYTGLTYSSLDKVSFRYQLVGFDKKPSKLTNIRHVSYTNLPPGKYTFYLRVVNGDDIWSNDAAQISFTKKAYFYQNPFFTIIAIVLVAFSIFFFLRLKFRIMKIREQKLEKIIAEKTHALEDEMHNSERLLLNILPEPIAMRLKHDSGVIADSFKNVSVLFSDIVGFTKLSSQYTPNVMVTALNDLFSRFDDRALSMGVEKIKTLGDAYIAVCGIPNEDTNHALHILEFARGILKDIEEHNKVSAVKFSMRIGINSGEVTAGIIGKTKFIYDIWGDAVNVASRMENCGVENKITVSESTYELTKYFIKYYEEDTVEVKGKGTMRIFRTE
ncbi:MAG: hypothetical protein J1G30_01685 [Spirochaetales bacterium]|nr:hypothetical protein [Spirochaetales bacterium]